VNSDVQQTESIETPEPTSKPVDPWQAIEARVFELARSIGLGRMYMVTGRVLNIRSWNFEAGTITVSTTPVGPKLSALADGYAEDRIRRTRREYHAQFRQS
jgi:hypothetical protein